MLKNEQVNAPNNICAKEEKKNEFQKDQCFKNIYILLRKQRFHSVNAIR